jgi:hypothetical protein
MDTCERCGAELSAVRLPFLRCGKCGRENESRFYVFACGDEERPECEWCEERLCRHAGVAIAA